MSFYVVVPARYASSRLPGKVLADLCGKPMVVRVVRRAKGSLAREVIVATDHMMIADAVKKFGHTTVMTRNDHASGTDRIVEVAEKLKWADDEIVVNVQGDEPMIDPKLIDRVAAALIEHPEADIATASHAIRDAEELFNPSAVKVVTDAEGRAMLFSRAPIPYARDAFAQSKDVLPENYPAQRHIGLYAYRVGFLKRYASLAPSPLEQVEQLEQLRAMWHGCEIRVVKDVAPPASGVDTPEDLDRMRRYFNSQMVRGLL